MSWFIVPDPIDIPRPNGVTKFTIPIDGEIIQIRETRHGSVIDWGFKMKKPGAVTIRAGRRKRKTK